MSKTIFDLNKSGWRFYDLPEEVHEFLCRQAKFDSDTLVKINPVRAVFSCGGYYVKFEVPDTQMRRWLAILAPKAKREYQAAKALQKAHIPVVEYLGWLRNGPANVTVSRCWPNGSATAYDYVYGELINGDVDGSVFFQTLVTFLNAFNGSNFLHPDLHLGNLLYAPATNELALVDVYGVKQLSSASRSAAIRHAHLLFELRQTMAPRQLIDLLSKLDVFGNAQAAEAYYWATINREAELRLHEWPKRQQQIMRAYPKLVKVEEDRFLCKDEMRQVMFDASKPHERLQMAEDDAFALFQASIYWQLCGIPHRRVVAYQLPNVIYLENLQHCQSIKSDNERVSDFRRELKIFGFDHYGQLIEDRNHRTMIYDIVAALDSYRHKVMFY